jgi:hypothetical protein
VGLPSIEILERKQFRALFISPEGILLRGIQLTHVQRY